ncbi:MAG: 1-acyl-sn-glycerol-3-phosphate acyltransferase [Oligoflexia bacterium]|nr:1-acyl-sn-glycerol-3-phosphate acyltransferase [Oligoflexia bacterium]
MTEENFSVLIFPEGTRSWGKGLGTFKKGAFYLAIKGGFPLRPIVVSSYHKNIDFGKLDAGEVLVDVLPDIEVKGKTIRDVDMLIRDTRDLFEKHIEVLDKKILQEKSTLPL